MTSTVAPVAPASRLPCSSAASQVVRYVSSSSMASSARLGVIRWASGSRSRSAVSARLLQQPVTAGGHHDRVQDHDGGAHLLEPGADGIDHRGVAQHADLDGVDGDVRR